MKIRLLITAIIAALVSILVLTGAVSANTHHRYHPSRITIRKQFHGRVFLRHAPRHKRIRRPCRTHRRVSLYWQNHGGHVKKVGVTRTNRRGRWAIPTKAHHGAYFARVKRRVLPRRHNAICGSAVSRKILISNSSNHRS